MANKYPLVLNGTNIEELQSSDKLVGSELVDDTTPQLGGDLDLNSSDITGTGNINITGTVTATSYSGDGSSLSGINTDLVSDTTPQLGGTLDANGNTIDMGTNTITDTKVGQWDTAYGWGNHGSAGYLTSIAANSVGADELNVSGDGSSGQYLASDGDGTMTWSNIPSSNDASALTTGTLPDARLGSGIPIQVVQGQKTTTQVISGSSYVNIVSATITPSSTSSKILITGCVTGFMESGGTCHLRFYRGGTAIAVGTEGNSLPKDTMDGIDVAQPGDASAAATMMWLDSPSTTSAITYYIKGHPKDSGGNLKINRTGNNSSTDHDSQTVTTITLMEITG